MRKFYNLNISSGILFNHDSKFRSKNNLTKKVINYLNNNNFDKKLELGDIDVQRDFGLAEEYIQAMYKINQHKKANDYIIATGKSIKVRDIINYAFKLKKLNYKKYVTIDKFKFSKKSLQFKSINISRIKNIGWRPKKNIFHLLRSLIK